MRRITGDSNFHRLKPAGLELVHRAWRPMARHFAFCARLHEHHGDVEQYRCRRCSTSPKSGVAPPPTFWFELEVSKALVQRR